ncbi:hypothetical protein CFC21_057004 [Triticum aestivum]|uniref:Uncharacterized protein n=2 Tax=Triticum aestivum TaxID=4565 RepID=A0A3B6IQ05_WHEAT|nr:uncharacterized protein LOC123091375 [Triticum aestivum]KAF7048200.1 hypothetical protein CFC21_057004 [Triticum aestivum]
MQSHHQSITATQAEPTQRSSEKLKKSEGNMVLGMNCFGAPEAASKVSPAGRRLGGEGAEAKEQKAAAKEEAAVNRAVGEANEMGADQVKAAGKEVHKKKRSGAPIVMHHFPFHSRPGLL